MRHPSRQCRAWLAVGALLLFAVPIGCSTVAVTNRKQLDLIPGSTMMSMSNQQYGDFLKANALSPNADQAALVRTVGKRIQGAVERYFRDENMSDQLNGYDWQFNLIESKEANAWCMPGGKVVVYTGILPVTQNEAGLAVVMGHEVAHAVLRHGGKRMTQGMIAQGTLQAAQAGLGMADMSEGARTGIMAVLGVGAQVGVLLPFSRDHESEADVEGLRYAIRAGYRAEEAPLLWERMAKLGGSDTPSWLSTHPASLDRAQKLRDMAPQLREQEKNWQPKGTPTVIGVPGTSPAPAPNQPPTKKVDTGSLPK